MIKLIGCLFILLSSSGIGYMLGSKYTFRVRELKLLKTAMQMLETEIIYSHTPLPDAFASAGKKSLSPIKEIFNLMAENLMKREFSSVGDALDDALKKNTIRLSLSKEDIEIIKTFGYSIGDSDTDGQAKSFKLILKQLDIQEMNAQELKNKNEKMFKNLGFLAGLAITILLL